MEMLPQCAPAFPNVIPTVLKNRDSECCCPSDRPILGTLGWIGPRGFSKDRDRMGPPFIGAWRHEVSSAMNGRGHPITLGTYILTMVTNGISPYIVYKP